MQICVANNCLEGAMTAPGHSDNPGMLQSRTLQIYLAEVEVVLEVGPQFYPSAVHDWLQPS